MLSIIRGLRADLLPHRLWNSRRWFYASRLWYYHCPADQLQAVVPDSQFYRLVDPDLRGVCHLLNEHGLTTTPSCQGHFHPPRHFRRVWEELKRQQRWIVTSGQRVRDSSTGRAYLFRDGDYALPWGDFSSFHAAAAAQQGIGYLGIFVPRERWQLRDALERTAHRDASREMGFDEHANGQCLYHIVIRAGDPQQRSAAWAQMTQQIAQILHASAEVVSGSSSRW